MRDWETDEQAGKGKKMGGQAEVHRESMQCLSPKTECAWQQHKQIFQENGERHEAKMCFPSERNTERLDLA